jgi:hypothetical protein
MNKPLKNEIMLPAKSTHKSKKSVSSSHACLIGAKEGKCEICKTTKILCAKIWPAVCEDCLSISQIILKQMSPDEVHPKKT